MSNQKMVITVGRECGSGGHEISERLEQHYGIKLYDRGIIDVMAEQLNEDPETLTKIDEKLTRRFSIRKGGFAALRNDPLNKLSKADLLYLREEATIRKLAEEESFILVGRAGNAILDGNPNVIRFFIFASEEFKIPRVKEYYHLNTDKDAKKKMEQVDKDRQNFYHYYSGLSWGSSEGYDFLLDSSVLGIDETVNLITSIVDRKFS